MQVANRLCIGGLSKINEMTYFDHPYCSNSTLTALGQELGLLPEFGGDKENVSGSQDWRVQVKTPPQKSYQNSQVLSLHVMLPR